MKLPQFFIDRPIFATVLSALIVLLGGLAMTRLPISEYPQVVPPTIGINATYPGASPETIAQTVAGPLEQQMTGVEGMLYMSSQSTPDGSMQLTLTFKIGTDLDKSLVEVQNRIQVASPRLPEEVRRLGVVSQKATRDMLMVVNLVSADGSMDSLALANYGRLRIRDQLLRIAGVRDAVVFGGGEYAMRVWLDPQKMAARNLAPSDVTAAIREQNLQVAAGELGQNPDDGHQPFEMTITTQGRLTEVSQFEDIIVHRSPGGQMVRVKDVGRVELGANNYGLRSLLDNRHAVAIPIFQSPGSNALEVATQIRTTMAGLLPKVGSPVGSFHGQSPPGLEFDIIYDPTQFISASIEEVEKTLIIAVVLVALVVILFLQTWRASLIPLIAVPVSIIGTFAVMLSLGFSINALSLFGLVLAIGIVVDDAIVVVENVERNIALGLNPRAATKQAMREVSGPILATALVLCSVFIPTAFISGLSGRFYQQFALTIAISTAISAFNSLTLSPALAALLLKPHQTGHKPGGLLLGWFFGPFNRMFAAASNGYMALAKRAIRLSVVALVIYVGLLFATGQRFLATPTSFVPQQDKGFVIAVAQLPDGASLDRTEAVVRRMGEIALATPGVDHVVQLPGVSFNGFVAQSNSAIMFVKLKPYEERLHPVQSPMGPLPNLNATVVAGLLSGGFFGINDAMIFALAPPPILGLGSSGDFKLYLQDRGAGPAVLGQAVQEVLAATQKEPKLGRCYSFSRSGVPRVTIDLDREKAIAQGLRLSDIYDSLQGYFGSVYVNDFNQFGRSWQVDISAEASHRMALADLEQVQVRRSDGRMVPLASFIHLHETAGPDKVVQYNTYPAIDINGAPNVMLGVSGDEAKDAMQAILDQVKAAHPGIGYEWTEITYQQILAGNSAIYVFPVCVLLAFLVLAAFYESITLPLAIVLIVPMCLLSALLGVNVMGGDNNIMTQIGLVVLVGLACKNAILIVEFARDAEILKGMKPVEAALEACRLRLRPILMTSIAFILGVLPLVIGTGAGSELRKATGIAVFFGMIGVTLFGLALTPVFYVVVRKLFPKPLHIAAELEAEDELHHLEELEQKVHHKPVDPPTPSI